MNKCKFCKEEIDSEHKECEMCKKVGCYNACPTKFTLGTSKPCIHMKVNQLSDSQAPDHDMSVGKM